VIELRKHQAQNTDASPIAYAVIEQCDKIFAKLRRKLRNVTGTEERVGPASGMHETKLDFSSPLLPADVARVVAVPSSA
jgi:hypothetical protein